MRKIFLSILMLLFLSVPALAYSQNFSTNTDVSDWVVVSGSWSATASDGLTTSVHPAEINHSLGSGTKYFEFTLIPSSGTNDHGTYYYWNDAKTRGIAVLKGTGSVHHVTGVGFTITGLDVNHTEKSTIILSINSAGNQITISAYNGLGNQIGTSQTVAYTYVESDRLIISETTFSSVKHYNIIASTTSPQAANTITWGSDDYVKDDTATFTWALTDTDWASSDRYFIRFYKDGIIQDFDSFNFYCLCYTQLGIGQQTGSFSVLADTAGSYKVTLEKGTLSYTNITSDTTRVRDYSSAYLVINKTVPYKTPVPVQYAFGFGGISLDYAIQSYYFNKDLNEYQFEHSFFGLNASGTRNVYFEKTGTYILKLRNVRMDKTYTQTTTEATFAIPETSLNITTPTLKIDASSYAYGETLSGNYTIDNTNFTAGVTYLDIRNVDNEIITEFYGSGVSWVGVEGQTGNLMINLLNSPASENFPAIKIFTGNNQLRLMLKNATGSTSVIKTINFTILDTNTAGYGLKLSKYSVLTKETFYAYVTTPETGARLIVLDPTQSCTTSSIGNYSCPTIYNIELKNASRQTIPLVIKTEGTYSVLLNNPAGDTEIMQNVKVIKSLAVTPTPTQTLKPGETSPDTTLAQIDGYVAWLGMGVNWISKLLFAAIWIVIIFAGGMVTTGGKGDVAMGLAFIPFALFTAIAYVPIWVAVIFIIIVGMVSRIFR